MFFKHIKLSLSEAEHILSDVPREQCFVTRDDKVLHNLHELERAILHMSRAEFDHHVSSHHNDFATWIREVIHDHELAQLISGTLSRKKISEVIKKRLELLEKHVDQKKDAMHSIQDDIFSNKEHVKDTILVVLCLTLLGIGFYLAIRLV